MQISQKLLGETIVSLERVGCQFWACTGPRLDPEPMITCHVCATVAQLKERLTSQPKEERDDPQEAVLAHLENRLHAIAAKLEAEVSRGTAVDAELARQRQRAQEAEAELAEIKRVTDPPVDDEEMPTDPAELREMWEFINRQARWQWHMAHKFGNEVERLRAELAEAKASADLWKDGVTAAGQVADRRRAERDALKVAITEATRLIREWMTPGAPLFDPGHAQQVMAILRKTIGHRTLAALAVPASNEDAPMTAHVGIVDPGEPDEGAWCEACGEPFPCPESRETAPDALTDVHGRTWDPHPFVQSRAVDNAGVCICGQPPDHRIHS